MKREDELLTAYRSGQRDFSRIDLTEADLRKVDLSGADLRMVELCNADLRGADLRDCSFQSAYLWAANLVGARLEGANFEGAILTRAHLEGLDLRGQNLVNADLGGAMLRSARLSSADLSGASLRQSTLHGADLSGTTLMNALLRGAELGGATLVSANLRGAVLTGANLRGADLRGACLQGARLDGADLRDADLRDADLRGAWLRAARFEGALIEGALIEGAVLDEGVVLSGATGIPGSGLVPSLGGSGLVHQSRQTEGERWQVSNQPSFERSRKPFPAPAPAGLPPASVSADLITPHSPLVDDLEAELDEVELGASAPQQVRVGSEFTARFIAYARSANRDVDSMLTRLSPNSIHHLGLKSTRWEVGSVVTVRCRASGLQVDDPCQTFAWSGPWQLIDFDVCVPLDAPLGFHVLKFDIAVGGVPAGKLRLDIDVGHERIETFSKVRGRAFRSGFASFASADRSRVLDRVSAMRALTGIEVFVDCVDLRPSEDWKSRLLREIQSRDVFLLFWSRAASASRYVEMEWREAYGLRPRVEFTVQPLETPQLAPPPSELQHLNFSDLYSALRLAELAAMHRPAP